MAMNVGVMVPQAEWSAPTINIILVLTRATLS